MTYISDCGYCHETQFTGWYSKRAPRDRYGRVDRDYVDSHPIAYCSEEHRDAADALLDAQRAEVIDSDPEVQRLRTERDRYRTAWRMARTRALSAGSAADRYAGYARAGQEALQGMLFTVLAAQFARKAAVDELGELRARLAAPGPVNELLARAREAVAGMLEVEAGERRPMWRVIFTDTESPTGLAPVCTAEGVDDEHADIECEGAQGELVRDEQGVYDCCPTPQIETHSPVMAAYLVELLNADAEDGVA